MTPFVRQHVGDSGQGTARTRAVGRHPAVRGKGTARGRRLDRPRPRDPAAQARSDRYEALKSAPTRISQIGDLSLDDLLVLCRAHGVTEIAGLTRRQVVFRLLPALVAGDGLAYGEGVLQIHGEGFGFLRSKSASYLPGPEDIYLSPTQIRRFGLRAGHFVQGQVRPPQDGERFLAMLRTEAVDWLPPEDVARRPHFEDLTPSHPRRRIQLEHHPEDLATRIVDLLAPIGFGQRALIVAPPRTGKTRMLSSVAAGLARNHPESSLIVLLIDERPEEVTEMQRTIVGEVISSTFDEGAARHIQVAEMVLAKAKRLVEAGRDVVILLDSLTRLARGYNAETVGKGRLASGGLDISALLEPKRFFGAARSVEEGGSLTIIATALVDTGSRMDEVIFEEFQGTGNSEIVLDRRLADRRVHPAFDVARSGTRREHLLLHGDELRRIAALRRALRDLPQADALELLLQRIARTRSNAEFLLSMPR